MNKTRRINYSLLISCIAAGIFSLFLCGCSSGASKSAVNKVLETPASVQAHSAPQGLPPLNIDAARITSETKPLGQGGSTGR